VPIDLLKNNTRDPAARGSLVTSKSGDRGKEGNHQEKNGRATRIFIDNHREKDKANSEKMKIVV